MLRFIFQPESCKHQRERMKNSHEELFHEKECGDKRTAKVILNIFLHRLVENWMSKISWDYRIIITVALDQGFPRSGPGTISGFWECPPLISRAYCSASVSFFSSNKRTTTTIPVQSHYTTILFCTYDPILLGLTPSRTQVVWKCFLTVHRVA